MCYSHFLLVGHLQMWSASGLSTSIYHDSTPAHYSFFFLCISSKPFQKLGHRSSFNLFVLCFSVVHTLVSFHNYYIFHLLYHSDLHFPPRLCHFSLSLPSFSPPFMSPASDNPSADWLVFADFYTGCNNMGKHSTNIYPLLQMVALSNWTSFMRCLRRSSSCLKSGVSFPRIFTTKFAILEKQIQND